MRMSCFSVGCYGLTSCLQAQAERQARHGLAVRARTIGVARRK